MSERELREAADRYREQAHDIFGEEAAAALTEIYDDFGDALAADPDVVAVARVCREYDPGSAKTRGGKLYNEGWRDAVNAVADNLERKYGFRLTDDGWEWTDE